MSLAPLQNESVRQVLIVRPGGMGDIILSTPAFTSLRESFPGAKIYLLTNPTYAPLFDADTRLDSVISLSMQKIEHCADAQQRDIERLTPILRQLSIDLVVDLRSSNFTSKITQASGARWRVGFSSLRRGFFLMSRYNVRSGQIEPSTHRVELARAMMNRIGIRCDYSPSVFVQDRDREWARDFFISNGIYSSKVVAIQPGASDPMKCWPAHKFHEVVALLQSSGLKALILGTRGQKQAEELAELCRDNAVSAVGKTSVTQLAACIEACDAFVGNDSGPMHLACAVGTPTVAVFTATDSKRYGPVGNGHQVMLSYASAKDVVDAVLQRI